MDEPNKTAATEPETRPEAAKLQDAPRRRVGSLTLDSLLFGKNESAAEPDAAVSNQKK